MSKNKSLNFAILYTIGGFFALVIGDLLFKNASNSIYHDSFVYIIPMIYVLFLSYKTGFVHDFKNYKNILKGILIGSPAIIIILINLWSEVLPIATKNNLNPNWQSILLSILILNLLIGAFEEILFRNVIMNTLKIDKTSNSYIRSVFISSILFGLIHLGNLTITPNRPIAVITQVVYAFMLGCFLATVYLKSESIYSVIFIHSCIDFSSSLTSIFQKTSESANLIIPDIDLISSLMTILIIFPIFIISLCYLRKYIKSN